MLPNRCPFFDKRLAALLGIGTAGHPCQHDVVSVIKRLGQGHFNLTVEGGFADPNALRLTVGYFVCQGRGFLPQHVTRHVAIDEPKLDRLIG